MATPILHQPVPIHPLTVEKTDTSGSDNKAPGSLSQVYGYFSGRSVNNNRALVFLGTFLSAGLMLGVPVGYCIAADFVDDIELEIKPVYNTLLKPALGVVSGFISMCLAGYTAGKVAECIYDRNVAQHEPNCRMSSAIGQRLATVSSGDSMPQLSVINENS